MRHRWLVGPALFVVAFAVAASPACGGSVGADDAGVESGAGGETATPRGPTATATGAPDRPTFSEAGTPSGDVSPHDASSDGGRISLPCVDGGGCALPPAAVCTSTFELTTYVPVDGVCVQGACTYQVTRFDCQSQGGSLCATVADGGAACQLTLFK